MEYEEKIKRAIENTRVIKMPKQGVATFGVSNIKYYIVTELMSELSVVREGRVITQRPRIVTPAYLIHLEGFSENARRYIDMMAKTNPYEPGLFYQYKNEHGDMNIIALSLSELLEKIEGQIDAENDTLAALLSGVEETWDVSLLKFMYELTQHSVKSNILELRESGLLEVDESGIPREARYTIEQLFRECEYNPGKANELIRELKRWGIFEQYEDRFFRLFRR